MINKERIALTVSVFEPENLLRLFFFSHKAVRNMKLIQRLSRSLPRRRHESASSLLVFMKRNNCIEIKVGCPVCLTIGDYIRVFKESPFANIC